MSDASVEFSDQGKAGQDLKATPQHGFMHMVKKVWRDSLTGIDGVTYDGLKVAGYPATLGAILVYLANGAKLVFSPTGVLDYVAFGTGFMALCGALGLIAAGVAVKSKTEPPQQ